VTPRTAASRRYLWSCGRSWGYRHAGNRASRVYGRISFDDGMTPPHCGNAVRGAPGKMEFLCKAVAVVEELDLEAWLRAQCAEYAYDLGGVFRRRGDHSWPLTAGDEDELERQLATGGHLLPLPKEPAALANVLEVSIVDFVLDRLAGVVGACTRSHTTTKPAARRTSGFCVRSTPPATTGEPRSSTPLTTEFPRPGHGCS